MDVEVIGFFAGFYFFVGDIDGMVFVFGFDVSVDVFPFDLKVHLECWHGVSFLRYGFSVANLMVVFLAGLEGLFK